MDPLKEMESATLPTSYEELADAHAAVMERIEKAPNYHTVRRQLDEIRRVFGPEEQQYEITVCTHGTGSGCCASDK